MPVGTLVNQRCPQNEKCPDFWQLFFAIPFYSLLYLGAIQNFNSEFLKNFRALLSYIVPVQAFMCKFPGTFYLDLINLEAFLVL